MNEPAADGQDAPAADPSVSRRAPDGPPANGAPVSPSEPARSRSGVPADASANVSAVPAPPRVSVIVPALDEAPNMPELFEELAGAFEAEDLDAEVLLVDDGSTDGTSEAAVAAARVAGMETLTVLRHRRNRGKTEALLTAAAHARGDYLVLFDADLQHSPTEIARFVERLDEGYDVVAGRKVGAYEKRFVSSIYNWLSRRIFRVPARDLNSMKAFRAEVLDRLRLRHDWHRYLVVLAHHEGFRIAEQEVELFPRRHGEAKYSGNRRVLVGMLDMISVWFQLVFSRKPMMFFGLSGIALLAAGGVTGLVALWLRFGLGQGFRPLLTLVTLLIVSGLLLFVFGFLAELVASLRAEVDALRRQQDEWFGAADRSSRTGPRAAERGRGAPGAPDS